MDINSLILAKIQKKKQIKASDIIKETGFSRTYVNRSLKQLRDQGKIIPFGKANQAFYVLAEPNALLRARQSILEYHTVLENRNLIEDVILDQIKKETGIFFDLKNNVDNLLRYSFLEMLNNAISHSRSQKILISMEKDLINNQIQFVIRDFGVGIFNSIREKFGLPDNMTAIQELLKGKRTTAPENHSGQGIFFTSKMADTFLIRSSGKRVQFINSIDEIFINDTKNDSSGTNIMFTIFLTTNKTAAEIYDKYSDQDSFEFSKTKIMVKLFKINKNLLSRSEARRIVFGLEKFKEIALDFTGVETVGQSFADEIFRVWQKNYPDKKITYINANENVEAMIKMAG